MTQCVKLVDCVGNQKLAWGSKFKSEQCWGQLLTRRNMQFEDMFLHWHWNQTFSENIFHHSHKWPSYECPKKLVKTESLDWPGLSGRYGSLKSYHNELSSTLTVCSRTCSNLINTISNLEKILFSIFRYVVQFMNETPLVCVGYACTFCVRLSHTNIQHQLYN